MGQSREREDGPDRCKKQGDELVVGQSWLSDPLRRAAC
jgi:hypothetical protein